MTSPFSRTGVRHHGHRFLSTGYYNDKPGTHELNDRPLPSLSGKVSFSIGLGAPGLFPVFRTPVRLSAG
jgi:hypothetical protein